MAQFARFIEAESGLQVSWVALIALTLNIVLFRCIPLLEKLPLPDPGFWPFLILPAVAAPFAIRDLSRAPKVAARWMLLVVLLANAAVPGLMPFVFREL